MHYYEDKDVDWSGISYSAEFIGKWLRKYARINVRDWKEKFGTVRVYCSIGFTCFHSFVYPGYIWIHKWWPYKLDLWLSYKTPILKWINCIIIPIQTRLYIWRYAKAIEKWPHLAHEILCCADYPELLKPLKEDLKRRNLYNYGKSKEKAKKKIYRRSKHNSKSKRKIRKS